jgi:two-component system CheB/CheR fusion protein
LEKRYTNPSQPEVAGFDLRKETERVILAESAPPGVVVNERMEIIEFRGRTAPYLEAAPGHPNLNLYKMARPMLLSDLRMLIQTARKKESSVVKKSLQIIDEAGRILTFDLKVVPIQSPRPAREIFFLILFENASTATLDPSKSKGLKLKKGAQSSRKNLFEKKCLQLERELAESKKYHESLAEEYEGTHEELAATNEEFQATNEELQSTNEELITVNEELQIRNMELNQLNGDLINFLSSVEIPILMVGSDGRIRRFTPNAGIDLHLISSDIGRPFTDIKSNFSSIGIELDLTRMIAEVTEHGKAQELEVQDRSGHWYRVQVKPYRTLEERNDGVVIAFIDIDTLKKTVSDVTIARAEADQANRAKDLFLAILSHELRTPLTTILSWAQMLRMGRLDEEKTKRAAEMIEESGKAQAQLINDLLDVSRIVVGKLSLDLIEIDPVTPIQAAIELVRPLADARSIQIVTHFDSEAGTVMCDVVRLQQVFSNLLSNAIKFSPYQSTIRVYLRRTPDASGMIQAQVIDSGKGVSPEFLPNIFDRFSQEDNSSTRTLGGLGLGLAIVKNLLELHKGRIEAQSEGEGKGSTFTVFLPLKSHRKTREALGREKAIESQRTRMHQVRLDGVRVLIVDDDQNAREAFREMLRSYGAEVQTAASSAETFPMLKKFKPHVLLSDIAMPGEDGYSLIRKVRALPASEGGAIPSVALTAQAGEEDTERAFAAGFQSHVTKPVDADYLANVIATLFASARH